MIHSRDIKNAVKVLKQGGVVAYPTETAYGLAADSLNSRAIKKIFRIKGRSEGKPIPLIAASLPMVKKFFYLDKTEMRLARRHWPGPVTILLKPKARFPLALTRGAKKIAIRVSSSKTAALLSRALSRPITSTSANISGNKENYSAFLVRMEFGKRKRKPDLVLEGGTLRKSRPSTIVSVENGKISILRQGRVKV